MAIKLLIVDDSAFMRKIIGDTVSGYDGIEVAGIARNGLDALEIIPKVNPDIITLDIEMPKLNGIETLKEIKKNYNIPVIMLSSNTGSAVTIEALEEGAFDFIVKPVDLKANLSDFKLELWMKILSATKKENSGPANKKPIVKTEPKNDMKNIKAVVIGASTGGPKALVYLIQRLPERIKTPIFIVQHMPKGFTTSLANRLNNESSIDVVEAQDGMIIQDNMVYLAPGDFHMILDGNRIKLDTRDKIHGVRPAVDYLFQSAADIYKDKLLGIVLTGMGKDGSQGMVNIKEYKGYNVAQSMESCVVYGMPGSAVSKGVVDEILDLEDISTKLNEFVRVR